MRSSLPRYLAHGVASLRTARYAFPITLRASVEHEIFDAERAHLGEICFAVQASLSFGALWRGEAAREHALAAFASLGVWDTAANNGVLIYVMLADRAVEIVADRGIAAQVEQSVWQSLCDEVQAHFQRGDFEAGSLAAVRGVAARLAKHFPAGQARGNELPNQPVLL
jgi:uncharacterized membrane protein